MSIIQEIERFVPLCEQEERDREIMLHFLRTNPDACLRTNTIAHMTASAWVISPDRRHVVMVYHNIYDSWSWIGGHADGIEDLCEVAMRELQEETGVAGANLVSREILSLETITVSGHMKKGQYVPSHLHFNVTYLAEADEAEELTVNEAENKAVKWWTFEEALKASTEPWMVEHVYKKLIEKCR